jgi:tetratricopeptide (TPR) repeat protein
VNERPAEKKNALDPDSTAAIGTLRTILAELRAQRALGRYEAVLERTREAAALATDLGIPSLQLETEHLLGGLQADRGDYDSAETVLTEAFWLAQRSHEDRLAAEIALDITALLAVNKNDHAGAILWSKHADAAIGRIGADPRLAARLQHVLGSLHYSASDFDAAESATRAALRWREANLAADDPHLLATLNNLALVLLRKNALEESERILARIYERYAKTFGQGHPKTIETVINLSAIHDARGQWKQAEQLCLDAAERVEPTLGSNHPLLALILNNIGSSQARQHRYDEAIATHQRALGIRKTALGPDHPQVAVSLINLASALQSAGELDQAAEHLQHALDIQTRHLPPTHYEIGVTYEHLGMVHSALGDEARAEALIRRAIAILRKSLGPQHPQLATTWTELGLVLKNRQKWAEARDAFERAATFYRRGHLTEEAALLDFSLADLLWRWQPERMRAQSLANSARETLRALDRPTDEVDAWLRTHPLPN